MVFGISLEPEFQIQSWPPFREACRPTICSCNIVCVDTEASASALETAASVRLWDQQREDKEEQEEEERHPRTQMVAAVVACGYQGPVCFSYHTQPLTDLFPNSEAREALPQSCNLSCSRLMRVAGCRCSEWGGSASAGCTAHPSRPPHTGSQATARTPHRPCRLHLSAATGRLPERWQRRRGGRTHNKSLLFRPQVHAFKYSVSKNETNETAASMEGRSAKDRVGS